MSREQKVRVTSNSEGTHRCPTNRIGSIKMTLVILLLTSLLAGCVLTIFLYYQTRSFAIAETGEKINELLLQQKSITDYATFQQKPEVYRLKDEGLLYPDYFSPQLLSGSYIRRNIHTYYNLYRKQEGKDEFYYKLAAINPRNPINKANEFELKLIEKLSTSGDSKYSEVIEINGVPYLYVVIPYAKNTPDCMRCHGDPADAPKELVQQYGDKAGFYEKVGELRAITSIRVPLESELAAAGAVFLKQGVMVFTVLIVIFVFGCAALLNHFSKLSQHKLQQMNLQLEQAVAERTAELQQEKLFSEDIINSLPGLFYMFDEKRFVQWNDRWETVTGYSPEELSEMYGSDFFEGDDKGLIAERMQKVFVEGDSDAEADLVTKSGKKIPYYFTGRLCRMGDTNYLIGLGIDITTRKIAEQEREALLKTLSAKNEELQSIVYTVSHDLKSPLVNINGFSDILRRNIESLMGMLRELDISEDVRGRLLPILNEDIPESLTFITAGTDKMKKLLDGLLQVSRIGTQEIRVEKLDMNQLMHRVMDTMAFQIKDKDISLTVGDLPPCKGDEKQINQVFSNLISNAIKYLSPDRQGVIRISGRVCGNECIYGVEDNGIGIDKAHQLKVFELFHRLHPDDSTDSQGLGLTIAKRALDRNGGWIWVESEEGKGSTFFVSLPKA